MGLRSTACLLLLGALLAAVCAPDTAAQAPILAWSFGEGAGSWQSTDPAGHITTTTDENVIRGEETGPVLEHAYTSAIGTISAMICPVDTGLTGGQSLHYWIRTSAHAMIATVLTETDGSNYMTGFSSLPGVWQEVVQDFSEFELTDDTEDENDRLDADQVQVVMFGDLTSFLAQAAVEIPFIVGPELGPRMMWLDDLSVSPDEVAPRWQMTQVNGARAVRLDGFESAPLQWILLVGKGIEVDYDNERKTEGEFSLRMAYDLPQGKLFGAITPLGQVPLTGMTRLSLALMSEVPVLLLVELKEADESKYSTTMQIEGLDEFETVAIPLSDLALGNDSTDENGQLDLDQVKELTIADVSVMAELPVAANTIWLDDIVFTE